MMTRVWKEKKRPGIEMAAIEGGVGDFLINFLIFVLLYSYTNIFKTEI